MFGWLQSKAECPIDSSTREWVDRRWEWLEDQFGSRRVREAVVVLPLADFFPDPYHGDDEDVRRMLDRVCGYMGIDPASVEFSVYEDQSPVYEGKLKRGTAGLYEAEEDGKFRIWLEAANLDDPLGMVATMAHELGHVHILGHGRLSADADDHEPLTDLLTVFMGMGVFNANAAMRESYWHAGQYSGWEMGRRGYLGMSVYGYAFARFALARGEDGSDWLRHLRLDVRSACKQAMRFLRNAAGQTDR